MEGFEPSSEVVGADEIGEVLSKVLVDFVVEVLDACFLEGSVHALDLAFSPGMLGLSLIHI